MFDAHEGTDANTSNRDVIAAWAIYAAIVLGIAVLPSVLELLPSQPKETATLPPLFASNELYVDPGRGVPVQMPGAGM